MHPPNKDGDAIGLLVRLLGIRTTAQRLGLNPATVSRWHSGKSRPGKIAKIAMETLLKSESQKLAAEVAALEAVNE